MRMVVELQVSRVLCGVGGHIACVSYFFSPL
jgi:hypothetical protein